MHYLLATLSLLTGIALSISLQAPPLEGESEPTASPEPSLAEADFHGGADGTLALVEAVGVLADRPLPPPAVRRLAGGEQVGAESESLGTDAGAVVRGMVIDARGAALGGVVVMALDAESDQVLATSQTQQDGQFELRGADWEVVSVAVDPQSLPMDLIAPLGQTECRPDETLVGFGAQCIDLRSMTGEIIVEIPDAAIVQGTLNGADGRPASGAFIRAVPRIDSFEFATTITEANESGVYELALVPGPYELQVLLPREGQELPDNCTFRIEVPGGGSHVIPPIDFSTTQVRGSDVSDVSASSLQVSRADRLPEAPSEAATATAPYDAVEVESSSATIVGGERLVGAVAANDGIVIMGRLLSPWGEGLNGMDVTCFDARQTVIGRAYSSRGGYFEFEGLEPGDVKIVVGREAPLGEPNPFGVTLLGRNEPISVTSFEGQGLVEIQDVVVNVERSMFIRGQIKVDRAAFEAFRSELIGASAAPSSLSTLQFLGVYLQGLELVQLGQKPGDGERGIKIHVDGSFQWNSALSEEDDRFLLRPRVSADAPGYGEPVEFKVAPGAAGRNTVEVVYPSSS